MDSVEDIMNNTCRLPFASRTAWKYFQAKCCNLRHIRAHLLHGTCPSRKATEVKDVKRYSDVDTVASDRLLIVKRCDLFVQSKELIVIPRQVFGKTMLICS
jgi:hypothetical protein